MPSRATAKSACRRSRHRFAASRCACPCAARSGPRREAMSRPPTCRLRRRGEVQIVLHKGMRIGWPRAETPTHYMTMGLHEDLNMAAKMATREMLNFVVETKGLSRDDALMLLSAAMDLHVTEIVDITKGVHAMLPKAIFQK